MAAGFGLLHLEPRAFWAMTPKEFEAALIAVLGPRAADGPPSRRELAALMQKFPD